MKVFSARRATSVQIGVISAVLASGTATALFLKTPISIALRSGEQIHVDLARDYKLRPDGSKVKIAGVPVGVVTGVRRTSHGAELTLKVDKNTRRTLGSSPSAAVRPTTILGGNYYLELIPGGDRDRPLLGTIPASRTTVPVELDAVTGMFDGSARTSLHADVRTIDQIFTGPATPALRRFVGDTPAPLQSSTTLLKALAGTQPQTDLTRVVTGFESASRQLAAEQQDFSAALDGVQSLSSVLDQQKGAINTTVLTAPDALRQTRAGLTALDGVLDQVRTTAQDAVPSVTALTSLLQSAPADLDTVRPVVHDLRPLMNDLSPTISSAVPAAYQGDKVLADFKSPVITRINGPLVGTLNGRVHGNDSPLTYQQVAYMFTLLNLNSMTTDSNGAMINFQPGVGPDTTTLFGGPSLLSRNWKQFVSSLPGGNR